MAGEELKQPMTLNYFDWFQRIVESLCRPRTQHEPPTTECIEVSYGELPGIRPTQTDYG
jgi:hypothetical protein